MNKKSSADLITIWIVELLAVILIFSIMLVGIQKIKDNNIHESRAAARDFALTYDVAAIPNNNIFLVYNIPPNYSMSLNQNCIINIQDKQKPSPTIYQCNYKDPRTDLILDQNLWIIRKNV